MDFYLNYLYYNLNEYKGWIERIFRFLVELFLILDDMFKVIVELFFVIMVMVELWLIFGKCGSVKIGYLGCGIIFGMFLS